MFNRDVLSQAKELFATYSAASPFPHIALKNIIDYETCFKLEKSFPSPDAPLQWRNSKTTISGSEKIAQINKLGFSDEWQLEEPIRNALWALNSAKFLKFLEELTGIKKLLPDPHFTGGGIHLYKAGSVLESHIDFNFHPYFNLDRRINVLLFLNSDWNPEWKGQLDLRDSQNGEVQASVIPDLGTMAIFSTTSTSYHGMRGPLSVPPNIYRKSLALYYYTNGRDDGHSRERHTTLWQGSNK